jgi:hypothetical protein
LAISDLGPVPKLKAGSDFNLNLLALTSYYPGPGLFSYFSNDVLDAITYLGPSYILDGILYYVGLGPSSFALLIEGLELVPNPKAAEAVFTNLSVGL